MAGKPFSERYTAQPANFATLSAATKEHPGLWNVVVMGSEPEASRADVAAFLEANGLASYTLVLGVPAVQTTLVNFHDGLSRMYPRADGHTVPGGDGSLATVVGPLR